MCAFAFGEVGLLPKEFYAVSWKEFILTSRGYRARYWQEWERFRMVAYTTASSNNRSKKRLPHIQRWFPLPTDKKNNNIDQESMARSFKLLREKHGNAPRNKGKDNG